eukprot:1557340-Amphidinium_carterae.2
MGPAFAWMLEQDDCFRALNVIMEDLGMSGFYREGLPLLQRQAARIQCIASDLTRRDVSEVAQAYPRQEHVHCPVPSIRGKLPSASPVLAKTCSYHRLFVCTRALATAKGWNSRFDKSVSTCITFTCDIQQLAFPFLDLCGRWKRMR